MEKRFAHIEGTKEYNENAELREMQETLIREM